MEANIKGVVGPGQLKSDGNIHDIRQGRNAEVITSAAHPDYFEASSRNVMFSAANQAAQAVSVALATTYTGLLLYNPVGSKTLLIPTFVKFALSVAPAAIAPIGIIQGFATTGGVTAETALLGIQSNYIGDLSAGQGKALSQATITTPKWIQMLADGFTAAALPAPSGPIDIRGLFTIAPGGFIAIGALTAVTGLGSISWEEVYIG